MANYRHTDKEVYWVLICLKDLRHHTLQEIVDEYNKQHPPALAPVVKKSAKTLNRALDFLMQKDAEVPALRSSHFIKQILEFLIGRSLVRFEVFTFFDGEPTPPTRRYELTSAGIQFLSTRR